jgi:hypothetical protein
MAVKLDGIHFLAAGGRFREMLTSRYSEVRSFQSKRIAGAEISAEQIARLIDHGCVAEIYASTVGLSDRERDRDRDGRLTKDVLAVRFKRNGMIFDEIEFNVTPAGRAGPDRFVELFNQAAREGYRW